MALLLAQYGYVIRDGVIHLEGQAYRQLAAGRAPWWVLFGLWFLLGMPLFLVLLPVMISTSVWSLIPYILIGVIVTLITFRGIHAKLQSRKSAK